MDNIHEPFATSCLMWLMNHVPHEYLLISVIVTIALVLLLIFLIIVNISLICVWLYCSITYNLSVIAILVFRSLRLLNPWYITRVIAQHQALPERAPPLPALDVPLPAPEEQPPSTSTTTAKSKASAPPKALSISDEVPFPVLKRHALTRARPTQIAKKTPPHLRRRYMTSSSSESSTPSNHDPPSTNGAPIVSPTSKNIPLRFQSPVTREQAEIAESSHMRRRGTVFAKVALPPFPKGTQPTIQRVQTTDIITISSDSTSSEQAHTNHESTTSESSSTSSDSNSPDGYAMLEPEDNVRCYRCDAPLDRLPFALCNVV